MRARALHAVLFRLGLGRTVPELEIGETKPFEKTLFSMCTPDVMAYAKEQVQGTHSSCSAR